MNRLPANPRPRRAARSQRPRPGLPILSLLAGWLLLIALAIVVSRPASALATPSKTAAGPAATPSAGSGIPLPFDSSPKARHFPADNQQAGTPAKGAPDRTGGPDAYGYTFSDDRDPGGPGFSWQAGINRVADTDWVAIRNVYTTTAYDDGVVTTTLPFLFNFYGTSYSQMHISTNGNVHFGPPNDYWPQATNPPPCLPTSSTQVPQAMIAPMWFDFVVPLSSEGGGGVYTNIVGTAPNRTFIVEWRDVYQFTYTNNRATFELLISEQGDMTFQYLSFSGSGMQGAGGAIGIQNLNGNIGLPYSCYYDSVIPERAIRYRLQPSAILSPATDHKGGAPGATVVYNQTLLNQTGVTNSFVISATGSWTTTVEPANTGTIPNGSSAPVTVRVQIPPGTPLGSTDTETVYISSTLPSPGAYTATAVLTTSVTTYGVEFSPPVLTKSGDYGATVTYTAQLVNRSGQTNDFRLNYQGNQWDTTVVPTDTGTIAADAGAPFTITVRIPPSSTLGGIDTLNLIATGQLPQPGTYFGVTTVTTTAGIWERKTPSLLPRSRGAAVAFPLTGRVYAIGGEYNNGDTNLPIEEYDPVGNNWFVTTNLQIGVSNVGAAAISNTIYIPGGFSGANQAATRALQAFYPLENRVEVVASDPLPEARIGAGVAAVGDKLYVIGGADGNLTPTGTVYEYDPNRPEGARWEVKAPMPTARVYLGVGAVDGIIYAIGGTTRQLADLSVVEAFNPATNSWSTRHSMNVPRGGVTAVGVDSSQPGCGGYLYALGGGYSAYTATAERYNPATDSWNFISSLGIARRSLQAAYYPTTTSLIAFGGWADQYESIVEAVRCSGETYGCQVYFGDVPPANTFYPYVRCLSCQAVISGYPDGYFHPGNNITRGQLSKIVANAAGLNGTPTTQTFQDVPPDGTYYLFVERMAQRGYIGGYPCGARPEEPCVAPQNLPYFRPNDNTTRGQIAKIVSNAAGLNGTPTTQTFQDVPPGSAFYVWVERLSSRGTMGGYACGGSGEPCVPPDNRPYFRPNSNATRGQTAKIVSNTFFPNCSYPATPSKSKK